MPRYRREPLQGEACQRQCGGKGSDADQAVPQCRPVRAIVHGNSPYRFTAPPYRSPAIQYRCRNEWRDTIQLLLLPSCYGGKGGKLYGCGWIRLRRPEAYPVLVMVSELPLQVVQAYRTPGVIRMGTALPGWRCHRMMWWSATAARRRWCSACAPWPRRATSSSSSHRPFSASCRRSSRWDSRRWRSPAIRNMESACYRLYNASNLATPSLWALSMKPTRAAELSGAMSSRSTSRANTRNWYRWGLSPTGGQAPPNPGEP